MPAPAFVFVALLLTAAAAAAQPPYKCRQADGTTAYRQVPCADGETDVRARIVVPPADPAASAPDAKAQLAELDRRRAVREAIEMGRPAVTMTRRELDLAMRAEPETIDSVQEDGSTLLRLTYRRDDRTFRVYTRNGVVTAVRDQAAPARRAACSSDAEIRDLEFDLSRIATRSDPKAQARLEKRLADARTCRTKGAVATR